MMRGVTGIIQLAFIVQSHANEQVNRSSEARVFVNELVNKLVDMAPNAHRSNLDDTTLGKSGQPAVLTQSRFTRHGRSTMMVRGNGRLALSPVPRVSMSHNSLQSQQRWVRLEAAPPGQTQTALKPTKLNPQSKGFEMTKPFGLVLEDVKDGIGAKIVEISPGGNAAKAGDIKEEMRLLSINGMPCKDASFDDIMTSLHDLDPSMLIQLEMEAPKMETAVASNPEPMNIRLDCAPEESKDDCSLTFEVQVTLEPSMTRSLRWKKARTMDKRRVMVLESVDKDSQAFRRGMRPGMVVKAMSGGSGRRADEMVNMDNLRDINMRNFQDFFRLARYPITFSMLENVKLGPEQSIDVKDRRIALAQAKRKEIERIDEMRREGGGDFPIIGMLVTTTILPPSVFLALNAVFGWYTGYTPPGV
jgi:hypothetical protein